MTERQRGGIRLGRVLGIAARLKLTLSLRYYQRNVGLAIGGIIGWVLLLGLAVAGAVALFVYVRDFGPVRRDHVLFIACWVAAAFWLLSPLSQMDTQNALDLGGLRLFPLSNTAFALAALTDAILSPMVAFILPPLLLLLPVLALRATDLPWLMLSLALLCLALLSLAQALTLWAYRFLQSRRFADASIVISIVLFAGLQALNLSLQHMHDMSMPPWLGVTLHAAGHVLTPASTLLFPGVAARAFAQASAGGFGAAVGLYTWLAAQAACCLWLAGIAARQFYSGELESGGAARARQTVRAPRRVAQASWPDPLVQALLRRERTYLARDPLLKLLFIQSLMSIVIIAAMFTLNALRGFGELASSGGGGGFTGVREFVLFLAAVMLGFMESSLLFNKYGYEGQLLTHLLLSPVDRTRVLAAKSVFYLTYFGALNIVLVAAMAFALHAPLHYAVCAVCVVAGNTCMVDLIGHYISIYFPFTFRRRGRRFRAVMPQPGCGYMLVYGLVFNACNVAVAPGTAALIIGTVFAGWLGLGLAALFYAALIAAAYRFALPHAAGLLLKREPELVTMLSRSTL
jgi:hypothetical protein